MNRAVGLRLQERWYWIVATAMAGLSMLGSPTSDAAGQPPVAATPEFQRSQVLAFEPNRGQTDKRVQFIARSAGYTVFLAGTQAVLAPRGQRGAIRHEAPVQMKLVGANPSPKVTALDELPGKVNYFGSGTSQQRVVNVPTYGSVRYAAVYPGIDLVYYGNRGRLEYDFVVSPDANPEVITLAFEGAQTIEIDDDGALVLRTADGEIRQPAPIVHQELHHEREPISSRWVRVGPQRVGVRVGPYDRTRPLVIDPLVLYSSYLGGSGDDAGGAIALDAGGNIYIAGATSSPDFPGAPARATSTTAAFVTKLAPTGQVLYTTYLLETDERGATGIAVDAAGHAYATGRTSPDRQTAWNDVFVAKLDAAGRAQQPSGYWFTFGGSQIDWGHRIAVDGAGQAMIVGATLGGSFPVTPGAVQSEPAGDADGFVAKVNATGTALVYATLLGGSGLDSANSIALDAGGNVYVTGSTESSDFPVTANAFQGEHRGCHTWGAYGICSKTAFVAKLSPDGGALVYSTFLGGSGLDQLSVAADIAVDAAGFAYVTGSTTASDFPTTPGVLQPYPGNRLCFATVCTDAFVAKLNANGSVLVYSTYLFGEAQDDALAIAVDGAGNAFIAGSTVSSYFPVVDAFQPKAGAFRDAFVAKLNASGSRLLYASYLGGTADPYSSDHWSGAAALALDAQGNAYVTGQTYTLDFPTTPDASQHGPGGGSGCGGSIFLCGDGFITKITAGGPGVATPITVRMTAAQAVAGGSIEAAWSGNPQPSGNDRIGIYALGHSDEQYEVYGGWRTTGQMSGTMTIALPAELAPGWYELRLWSGDPSVFTPLARSAPFELRSSLLDAPSGGGGSGGGSDGSPQDSAGSSVTPFNGGGGAADGWPLLMLGLAACGRNFRRPRTRAERRSLH